MARYIARLKQHWVRHLLAALQVAVGVAAVTAVLIDVVPVLRSVSDSREVATFSAIYGGRSSMSSFRSSVFTIDDAEYLTSTSDTITAATVYEDVFTPLVRYDGDLWAVRGMAKVSPSFAEVVDMELIAGRFFTEDEVKVAEPQVVVISQALAERIFGDRDPIGETMNIRPQFESARVRGFGSNFPSSEGAPGLDVRVIGVFGYPEGTTSFRGFFASGPRSEIFIPATGQYSPSLSGVVFTAPSWEDVDEASQSPTAAPVMHEEHYTQLFFRAVDGLALDAEAEARALLESRIASRRPDGDDSVGGRQPQLLIDPATPGTTTVLQGAMIVGAMGIAALIVSGFAVFTTFLASVAERVRTIGLARAIGATRGRVLREVVGEAVLLSSIGGVIGIVLAYPVRQYGFGLLTAGFGAAPSTVDIVVSLGVGVLIAMGIGAIASLYPGWTVARLLPAEAFYEE